MKIVGKTDIGNFRQRNEDSFDFGYYDDGAAWALVCDGMGGVHGGQIASSTVVEFISEKMKKCYMKSMPVSSFENLMLSSITTANVTVYDRGSVDMNLRGMGTTVVAAVYKNNEACIAHVGDSRAYKLCRDSVELITKDHSLVQEMLDKGQITRDEYENTSIKNIITRAIGISEEVDIDFDFVCINSDEALLLCSDGFSGFVTENEMLEIYNNTDIDCLADEYINRANDNGSHDNITVVVMKG